MMNRERNSSTVSSDRVGRCAMSTGSFLSGPTRYMTGPNSRVMTEGVSTGTPSQAVGGAGRGSQLRVVLDDELLLDREVDLRPGRELVDEDPHATGHGLEPGGDDALAVGLASHDERGHLQRLLADVDDVVSRDLVRRDVDLLAVDQEVAVNDQLAGVAAGAGEAGTVDDVVQAALEQLEQVVTGLAGATVRLGVVVGELLLEHAVGEAGLLLLLELRAVLALLDPRPAVLAGRVGTLLELGVAADEVDTETARLAGHGAGVTGHVLSVSLSVSGRDQTRRRLGGRQPLCGVGVTSWMVPTSRPMAPSERIAVSRPEPGPLTKTSTRFMPCSIARRPAASAAICAAYGVDLREPLKATVPADAHEITAPVGSVIVTMVLLNVLLMWAWPAPTFFFSLRRTFLAPAAVRLLGGMTYQPSSCRPQCAWGPCGCARWSWCAGRAPGDRDGGAAPRRSRSRPCGGCQPGSRGGGHPPS